MITAEHRKLKEEYTEKSLEGTMLLDADESEDTRENSIEALKKVIKNYCIFFFKFILIFCSRRLTNRRRRCYL